LPYFCPAFRHKTSNFHRRFTEHLPYFSAQMVPRLDAL
jgi:hypothetical protein